MEHEAPIKHQATNRILARGSEKKERTTGLNQIEVEEEEWKCKDEINQE
jgi:hypothetical protein